MGPWQSVPANREGGGTDMRGIGRAQGIVVSLEKGIQKTLDCWGSRVRARNDGRKRARG
jgi:hypothetical protein